MRLLNIVTSPRGKESASIAIANTFLDAYRERHPSVDVDTLNVWDEALPEFNGEAIGAKYKAVSNAPMTQAESATWHQIQSLATRVARADRIVLGVPMWNFNYPYKLKQFIDLVTQRNLLFTFNGSTYGPLLKIPRALVIHVRGQSGEGSALHPGFDFQTQYIEFWLKFIGVEDVASLTVEHTWDASARQSVEQARIKAIALAANF
jgi:FMN-dependent NADH-azoreductase